MTAVGTFECQTPLQVYKKAKEHIINPICDFLWLHFQILNNDKPENQVLRVVFIRFFCSHVLVGGCMQ